MITGLNSRRNPMVFFVDCPEVSFEVSQGVIVQSLGSPLLAGDWEEAIFLDDEGTCADRSGGGELCYFLQLRISCMLSAT